MENCYWTAVNMIGVITRLKCPGTLQHVTRRKWEFNHQSYATVPENRSSTEKNLHKLYSFIIISILDCIYTVQGTLYIVHGTLPQT